MLSRAAVLAALALAVASCSDSSTEPTGLTGSLSFTYGSTLATGTSYSASGALPTSETNQATQEWAAGFRDDQENQIGVVASRPRTGGQFDLALLSIERVTPGTSTINVNTCDVDCTDLVVIFNTNQSGTSSQEVYCFLETGSVTVASVSSSRISGTFSGSGTCGTVQGTEAAFTVSNGSFNAPIISGFGNAMVMSR